MNTTARTLASAVVLASMVTAGALAFPSPAWASAGSPQICTTGASCTIGEFVYDDSYVPVTSATCTLTSRYPDGSLHLNSQAMTGASDGWYYYSFTTPSTLGYYRAQVCCTVGSDYMCLDKAFESAAESTALTTDSIASAVWGYSSRTMTGFGSLVSDIWGHSAREVTNLGVVVRDVWTNATRTLTSSTATSGDIDEIEKIVKENRLLLERLVNKPIIQNFLEEEEVDLGAQITQSKEIASGLYLDTQLVVSKMGVVLLAWEDMTGEEISKALNEVSGTLGHEEDTDSSGTVIGQAKWLAQTWEWQEAEDASEQALSLARSVGLVERKLKGAGGWKSAYTEAKNTLSKAEELEKLVGASGDLESKKTIYARLEKVSELALVWDQKQAEADQLLKGWKASAAVAKQDDIERLGKAILAINRVPKGYTALTAHSGVSEIEKKVKNKLLSLRALVGANRTYLARGDKEAMANTWLEEGSVIFKSLVTNPSSLISQEVELKYYLPPEVKEEDILGVDTGLEVKFDSEKNQHFVQGEFTLKANESKTVFVRVDDVWVTSQSEIESLRQQANELSKPLAKTAFFAQGVTFKSDIDVALDKIVVLEATAVTPEQKIRAWREGQIEMGGVKVKIEKLKELVAQVSASGGLFGFVGGAQVMAVWGMVIIFVAGFVFLALYMKKISEHKGVDLEPVEIKEEKTHGKSHHAGRGGGWKIAITVLVTALVSSVGSAVVVKQMILSELAQNASREAGEVAGEKTSMIEEKDDEKAEEGIGGPELVRVVVPSGGKINLREEASLDAKILDKISETVDVVKLDEKEDWVMIEGESSVSGWVSAEFVEAI